MKVDVLIVGAGFAGAATAFHLSRRFTGSILVAEREPEVGSHASGRNARLVFQQVDDPATRKLLVESCEAYVGLADSLDYHPAGSLLLGSPARLAGLAALAPPSEWMEAGEVARRVPLLADHPFEAALWTPSDGVMPTGKLLEHYLTEAGRRGVEVRTSKPVDLSCRGSRLEATVGGERIEAGVIVNAAGAWADGLVSSAGAGGVGLRPLKRHLFVVDRGVRAPAEAPFVWDLEIDFYLRPDNGMWLVSLCEELAGRDPDDLELEPAVVGRLQRFLETTLAAQTPWKITRSWSCFRTHAAAGPAHIGPDEEIENLFWVAGLGGHGMGASWAIGKRAARLLAAGR